ncbi:MAG: VTT domain-containing protein [Woeseiaceae bacterium]|nr:VTT domain-containing protein [Woeseiaceae bacterium]
MKNWYRATLLVLIAAAAGFLLAGGEQYVTLLSNYLSSLPEPISSILAVCVVVLGTVLFIPNSILFIATGVLFGAYWGTLLNAIGYLIGSSLAFLIARYIARDYIISRANKRVLAAIENVSSEGWRAVAILRLVPTFPSFLINYILGVTSIRLPVYAWTSLVFIFPGLTMFTYIGATGRAALDGENSIAGVLTTISLIVLVVIIGLIVRRRRD